MHASVSSSVNGSTMMASSQSTLWGWMLPTLISHHEDSGHWGVSLGDRSWQGHKEKATRTWGAGPFTHGVSRIRLPWRLWLGDRGSGLVIRAGASPFFLTPPTLGSPPACTLGVAGNLTSLLGPAPHSPRGLRHMFVEYLFCATWQCRP
jgi:hypothetical protein